MARTTSTGPPALRSPVTGTSGSSMDTGVETIAWSNTQVTERSYSKWVVVSVQRAESRVDSVIRTTSSSTPGAESTSPTAATAGSRSSTRTAISSTSGRNTVNQAGSSSTVTTSSTQPTAFRARHEPVPLIPGGATLDGRKGFVSAT